MPELPKISQFTRVLTTPEASFEKMVKEATKIELPAGPLSMITKVQESLEAGKAPNVEGIVPKAPKIELPKLPPLPKIEEILPGGLPGGTEKGYQLAGKEEKPSGYVLNS